MHRLIGTAAFTAMFAISAVYAQESRTKTETKTEGNQRMVTYTGCLQTGTETRTFTLSHIVPVSRTTVTAAPGAAGEAEVTTSTTYMLVPGPQVEFQQLVGHKVEVTGMLIPEGDSKSKTTTKVERDDGPDSKTVTREKVENGMPQFRVTSIRHLADSCQ
jgi:hypothetical protein